MSTTHGAEVSVNIANGYINDYLADFFTPGITPTKAMIIDADLIRNYLANENIKNVKFMLGKKMIDNNGTNMETFTLIVAGYDSNNNYVLTSDGKVLDDSDACPPKCPTTGTASNDNI